MLFHFLFNFLKQLSVNNVCDDVDDDEDDEGTCYPNELFKHE